MPALKKRIESFMRLSEMIGHERVIWRFDPMIVTPSLTPRELLTRIWRIGNQLKGFTDKLVFSFVDVKTYRKVQNNLVKETTLFSKEDVERAELNEMQRQEIVEGLVKIRKVWETDGWSVTLATCAEAFDYETYGIEHNRCIDGELMKRIFHEDKELLYYLHTGKLPEPNLFGEIPPLPDIVKCLKDKGQRKSCGCMVSKDIGMYNTCPHLCVYCYANTSKELVLKNATKHNYDREHYQMRCFQEMVKFYSDDLGLNINIMSIFAV